jgi:hypothetical protein
MNEMEIQLFKLINGVNQWHIKCMASEVNTPEIV